MAFLRPRTTALDPEPPLARRPRAANRRATLQFSGISSTPPSDRSGCLSAYPFQPELIPGSVRKIFARQIVGTVVAFCTTPPRFIRRSPFKPTSFLHRSTSPVLFPSLNLHPCRKEAEVLSYPFTVISRQGARGMNLIHAKPCRVLISPPQREQHPPGVFTSPQTDFLKSFSKMICHRSGRIVEIAYTQGVPPICNDLEGSHFALHPNHLAPSFYHGIRRSPQGRKNPVA